LGWFSAKGGPEGPGHAAESRFLYQFLAVKCAVLAYRVGTAILQEIDATHRKTALAGFRWQSIDFVDALNAPRHVEMTRGIFYCIIP
jgi:hypothetical protein